MEERTGGTELLTEEERELLRANAETLKSLCVITAEEWALIDAGFEKVKREYAPLSDLSGEKWERIRAEAEKATELAKKVLNSRENEKYPRETSFTPLGE